MTRFFHIFELRYYTLLKTQRQVMWPIDWLKKDIPLGTKDNKDFQANLMD